MSLDVGGYDGFYFRRSGTTRLCLGWVAITYYSPELDEIHEKLMQDIEEAKRR